MLFGVSSTTMTLCPFQLHSSKQVEHCAAVEHPPQYSAYALICQRVAVSAPLPPVVLFSTRAWEGVTTLMFVPSEEAQGATPEPVPGVSAACMITSSPGFQPCSAVVWFLIQTVMRLGIAPRPWAKVKTVPSA